MTKFLIAILLIIGYSSVGYTQEKPSPNIPTEVYLREALSFLNAVKNKELGDPSVTLVDVPKFSCFDYTVNDSTTFTIAEMDQMANEIKSPKIKNWRDILSPKIRFLQEKYVNTHSRLIKNPKREARLFNKYFGGCYYNFSAPIFLRNYTFCLFYVDKICAAGQSSGELQVFEKKDGLWKQLPSRCEWSE